MQWARRRAKMLAAAVLLLAAVGQAGDRVHPSPDAVEPLAAGSRVPAVSVETADGDPVDLAGLVREHGALLVFYRGGW